MEFSPINLLFFSLLTPLVVSVITIFSLKWLSTTLPKRLPPSPPSLPIFGNIHQIVSFFPNNSNNYNPQHRSFHFLSEKYGPLMRLSFASTAVVVVSSPEAAREIMKNHDIVFSNRPKSRIAEKILHGSLDVASAPYGERWRQLKSICMLHLLSNKRVQSFSYIRDEETSEMIQKIRKNCYEVINLSEILLTVTNDVVTRVTIGKRSSDNSDKNNDIVGMLERFIDVIGSFNIADYIPWLGWINCFMISGLDAKVERVSKEIDKIMDDAIEQHYLARKTGGFGETKTTRGRCTTLDFVDILLDIKEGGNLITSFPLEHGIIKALILV